MDRFSSAVFLLLVGCDPTSGTDPSLLDQQQQAAAGASSTPAISGGAKPATTACAEPVASDDESAVVCHRWKCERDVTSAVSWDGNAAQCSAGTIDDATELRALRHVNVYRFLAGVPEIRTEARWKKAAQSCALIAQANRKLDHHPSSQWACWSAQGAAASAVSLIANRSAPVSIDSFMEDPGNETTMVHRRWLIDTKISRVGIGSTSGYACIIVDGRAFDDQAPEGQDDDESGDAPKASADPSAKFVAWPPSGVVPIEALTLTKVDTTGWTVQSATLDLDGATVDVSVNGTPKPVTVQKLDRGEGSFSAVRFLPKGWSVAAGQKYDVTLKKGKGVVVSFSVRPIGC